MCWCDCGNKQVFVSSGSLKNDLTKSCGCLVKKLGRKRCTTHGKSQTPEWRVWHNMNQRCYNKNNPGYKYYGGRGIKVCKRWRESFENFLKDMDKRPSPELTIERINNDKGYRESNCKWATRKEQNNNRRCNKKDK